MPRVIQDSDEELDDDLEIDAAQPEKKDASPKHSTSDASSTEALRRQIEAAHRAHLQSQFPLNDGHPPDVVDGNHQQREIPTDGDSNSTPSERFESGTLPLIYDQNSKGIFSSLPPGKKQDQKLLRQAHELTVGTSTSNEIDWALDGTMREAYAQHNPNAMFPEPSSTVPNATLTQQRVLERVVAPALLGSDIDASRVLFQPEASIPWSEYMKSPTDTGEQPRSSAQEPHISQITPAAIPERPLHERLAPDRSQRSRQGSVMLVGSPPYDVHLDANDSHEVTIFAQDGGQMSLSSSSTVSSVTRKELPSSHRSRKKISSPAPALDDDSVDLALPREQYKPRPSRSRSLKIGTQEPIDYSVRPEKAAKASKRRRSTPTASSLAEPLSMPDKVRQICEMGFTPSTSERALKKNNGDVTQSVDWLIINRIADDELGSQTSQMSKIAGAQETANNSVSRQSDNIQGNQTDVKQTLVGTLVATSAITHHSAASAEPHPIAPIADVRSPAKVQVVIPKKSLKSLVETPATSATSLKKAKRRKTTLDLPEPAATDNALNGAKVEKKRGRGRPKKAVKASITTENVQDDQEEAPSEHLRASPPLPVNGNFQINTIQHEPNRHPTTAITAQASYCSENSQPQAAGSATATSRFTPESSVLPDRPEVEPITPERVKKPTPRDQLSNNRPKVPYRVGLSKRARIAPLLRVMKK